MEGGGGGEGGGWLGLCGWGGEMEGRAEEAAGGAAAGGPSVEGGLRRGGKWWRRWGACRCGMNGRFGHDGLAG